MFARMKASAVLSRLDVCWRAHPWHGVDIGEKAPEVVTSYIELVPSDTVKFELDKQSGFLKIDRPQRFSNVCPTMYGFIPQTYCGDRLAKRAGVPRGDGDPLDICVLSERSISHGDFIVKVVPIGGFCLIDQGDADDKIIGYVAQDDFFKGWSDLSDAPESMVDRLKHYFLTYKMKPGTQSQCYIKTTYNREEAMQIIREAQSDYEDYMKASYYL